MKRIDLEKWDRRDIFAFFSPLSNPFYSVCFRLDVTALRRFCRQKALSFYYAMIFLVTRAVNGTEAFLYTLEGGQVCLLDGRRPSFTDREEGEAYFHIVTMPLGDSLEDFCMAAKEKSRAQRSFIDYSSESPDLVYLSSLPWLDLTALTNERDLDPDDAIPRIAWGKYVEENGRLTLGLSVEVNHRFVDGADIGAFAKRLEEMIAAL
ncbi:MAG: chloramphenicol acetyltransferase [Oscillospiraceae bacterium]|nr:chloramphenicol acetyltransferase [Oscillospiraceae bacterium]